MELRRHHRPGGRRPQLAGRVVPHGRAPRPDRRHRLRAEDQVAGPGEDHRRRWRPHRRRRRRRLGAAARRLPGQGHRQGRGKSLAPPTRRATRSARAGCSRRSRSGWPARPPPRSTVGADKKTVKTLDKIEGEAGEALETTLDMRVQQAAAGAVRDLKKTASLVAIRPCLRRDPRVVNNQGGFNRALDGRYPPGSTFKAVTADRPAGRGDVPERARSPAPSTSRWAACRSATPTRRLRLGVVPRLLRLLLQHHLRAAGQGAAGRRQAAGAPRSCSASTSR